MMFNYQQNTTSSNLTEADLDIIGEKTVGAIGAYTLYTPRYKGNHLKVYNKEVCGGDCFTFA
jgi:hypothetical protein